MKSPLHFASEATNYVLNRDTKTEVFRGSYAECVAYKRAQIRYWDFDIFPISLARS